MKFRRFIPAVLLLAPLCVVSCKDKEETEELKASMLGSINIVYPDYVAPGTAKTFKIDTMSTLHRTDDVKIGYYVTNPTTGDRDTIIFDGGKANPAFPEGKYTFTAPSALGSYSLSITGYSAEYYTKTATAQFVVVSPALDGTGSLTGLEFSSSDPTFTDPRDLRIYHVTRVGDKEWMRQNLAWKGLGASFEGCEAMDPIFGRFYTWEEANSACPDGWRLPSDNDWAELASAYSEDAAGSVDFAGVAGSLMVDASFNGGKMWEYWPAVKITDDSRLSAIPVGYAEVVGDDFKFSGLNDYFLCWTSDVEEGLGVYRYIYVSQNTLFRGLGEKTMMAAPVRCVR